MFPAILVVIPNTTFLPLAFVINGLREMEEPARKALIVDLAGGAYQGRIIGLLFCKGSDYDTCVFHRRSFMVAFTADSVCDRLFYRRHRSTNVYRVEKVV